ncbi:probable prolyl 4-hydroxylase 9 isoform X2 [Nymphaea colorata]|uniref:probable prolyl 4-hydroxylase 9 isoform X2 n=1 Tax=Nymphaea colorata TaxID=210225 RepID=UPI00129EEB09|nr:probable prolyl 4-hydroxylase 9 isoform X2 [Nymphaea colorata]
MKVKGRVSSSWNCGRHVGLPLVFILCSLFFAAGFFASLFLLSQDASMSLPELRDRTLLEEEEEESFASMAHGRTEPEQCQTIIRIAKNNLEPSTLMLRKGETAENTKGIRTSSGTFISAAEDKTGTLDLIEQKIAKVTMIPRSHGEAFNILRYQRGQKYDSHYDVFNPAEYGPQKSQRMASFLLYLTDVEEGGETMFPFEDDNVDVGYDYKGCIGLKVKPKQGDALLFYSLFPNGTIDVSSLHGSCPVINGEKWVATKWIRDQIDN